MAQTRFTRIAAGVLSGIFLISTPAFAAPDSPAFITTPPQPAWNDLSVRQKIVLAPLSDTWDSMASYRRKKWLLISSRFTSQSPTEQQRIQTQMREWSRLTPEQQREARQNFKTAQKLTREKRQAISRQWREYNRLSENDKLKFQEGHLLMTDDTVSTAHAPDPTLHPSEAAH